MLFLILLIPLFVGGGMFLLHRKTITPKEWAFQFLASALVIIVTFFVTRHFSISDVENWNGRIVDKDRGTESCCHSYECFCQTCTDSNGRTYSCNCSTCYEHSRDYWWELSFSTGDRHRDGCNGSFSKPSWWADASVGDPASIPHSYQNYLKANPHSLLVNHTAKEKYLKEIPDTFPQVHDIYQVTKVLSRGVPVPPGWERRLKEINADLGAKKQVDILIFLTKSSDPEYAWAIEEKWLYGPKNALIIVMGVPDKETISWVRTVTISKVEELKIALRDGLQGRKLEDPHILTYIEKAVQAQFHRTPMAEFEYLASSTTPRGWWFVLLVFVALVVSVGLSLLIHYKDLFNENFGQYQRWKRW